MSIIIIMQRPRKVHRVHCLYCWESENILLLITPPGDFLRVLAKFFKVGYYDGS